MPPEPEIVEAELVDDPAGEIAVRATTLFHTSDPHVALSRMAEIAAEIVDVIDSQKMYARISGKKYVTCPGWKTVGGMFGLSPYTVWTKPNETGDGYVARVEVRTLDERTIAAAEAECSRDEPNWKSRPKHALRSMAETRATSRALRGPLEQVFSLAGFETTPAEEMPLEGAQPEPSFARRSPADPVAATPEQFEEIAALIRALAGCEPDVDWKIRARELAGVPSQQLTVAGAKTLIEKLQERLEQLVDEEPTAA